MSLIKLDIPEGWSVIFNTFEVFNLTNLQNDDPVWDDLTNTLLAIKNEEKDLNIDVGWYPEFEPEGNFELKLNSVDWRKEYFVFKSKSQSEVINCISFILEHSINNSKGNSGNLDFNKLSQSQLISKNTFPLLLQPGWSIKSNNYYHYEESKDLLLEMENKLLNCKIKVQKTHPYFSINISQIIQNRIVTYKANTFLESYEITNKVLDNIYTRHLSFENNLEIEIN